MDAAFSSILQDVLHPMGLSSGAIGVIGFLSGAIAAVSAMFIGPIADKYFVKKLKLLLYYLFGMYVFIIIICILVLPSPFSHTKSVILISDDTSYNTKVIIVATLICIYAMIARMFGPIYLEIAAEVGYPVSEGTSATMNVFLNNVAALIFIGIGSWINTYWELPLLLSVILLCWLMLCVAKEEYKR